MSRRATIYVNYYEYKNSYDLKNLKDYDRYALRNIQQMEEEIQKVKEYRQAIFEQAQKVANTKMKTVVKLQRSQPDNVYYFLSVYTTPEWEDLSNFYNHIIAERILNERHPGKERHNVIKRAQELADVYDAIFIKNF